LLAWANKKDAWIIEDDYDSEFRYHGHPLPALKSLDHEQRVLYTGTFSKVLFPGLRLAYLVVPPLCNRPFTRRLTAGRAGLDSAASDGGSVYARGHFARHLRKMSVVRHQARLSVDALEHVFGSSLHIQPQAGEYRFWFTWNTSPIKRWQRRLRRQGWVSRRSVNGMQAPAAKRAIDGIYQFYPCRRSTSSGETIVSTAIALTESPGRAKHQALSPSTDGLVRAKRICIRVDQPLLIRTECWLAMSVPRSWAPLLSHLK
jgi:hypothetical protein